MKNAAFPVFSIISFSFLLSCAGVWYPPDWDIRYQLQDQSSNAIIGLQSVLYHNNGAVIDTKYSDSNGYIAFNGKESEKDKYKSMNEFLSEFNVIIDDVDGTNNNRHFS